MTVAATPKLAVEGLHAGYNRKDVVYGLDIALAEGEVLVVLGHNGAGKTTAMSAVFGLIRPSQGSVRYEGAEIAGRSPVENVRAGIAYVPQGHGIFRRLSVQVNLELGAFALTDKGAIPANLEQVFELFPILRERRDQVAGTLSGGQQQMLAIGMALMHRPRVMLLDEPSIGLAPNLVDRVMQAIRAINRDLGVSILMVEQNVRAGLSVANRVAIMKTGRKIYDGPPDPLHDRVELMRYF